MIINAVLLSRNPAIIVVANNSADRYLGDAKAILDYYKFDKAYILVSPSFQFMPNQMKISMKELII